MPSPQHSPGPWARGKVAYAVYDSTGAPVCYCDSMGEVSRAEEAANARLIAAAPELLEALALITDESQCLNSAIVERARAALAKAKGGQ